MSTMPAAPPGYGWGWGMAGHGQLPGVSAGMSAMLSAVETVGAHADALGHAVAGISGLIERGGAMLMAVAGVKSELAAVIPEDRTSLLAQASRLSAQGVDPDASDDDLRACILRRRLQRLGLGIGAIVACIALVRAALTQPHQHVYRQVRRAIALAVLAGAGAAAGSALGAKVDGVKRATGTQSTAVAILVAAGQYLAWINRLPGELSRVHHSLTAASRDVLADISDCDDSELPRHA